MPYKVSAYRFNVMTLVDDTGQAYAYLGGTWIAFANEPPGLVDVNVGPGGVWGLDAAGNVYQHLGKNWTRDHVAKDVKSFSQDGDGNLWCVNKDGEVFFNQAGSGGGAKLGNWVAVSPQPPLKQSPGGGGKPPVKGPWLYTVKEGDHLFQVVRNEYGVGEAAIQGIVDQIATLNRGTIADVNHIIPGQVLKMPPKP
ncbi:MAG: LysM peptidoglycan-binding domain-containing protein [Anaerolineae bacterium]|nr:LysM peptidoglycan-binding domain-containing protein [Anaerolineae bacterium]